MKYSLSFPTALEHVNAINDNVDVCLQLDNGHQYTFVVATPDNLKFLMEKDNIPYVKPGMPFLIVEEINTKNITQLIEALLKNGEDFLRVYGGDWN